MAEKEYLIMLDINTRKRHYHKAEAGKIIKFADKIPDNSLVVMQIAGDEKFNEWARKTGLRTAEKNNPIVYITVTKLKPVSSRIERLTLEMAA